MSATTTVIDQETGEDILEFLVDQSFANEPPLNNVETGEPEALSHQIQDSHLRIKRTPFQIPREALKVDKKKILKKGITSYEPVPVGACFGQTNPICLFLPAIIYFRWFLAILMIFEVTLHVWAHHKNKRLQNAGVYFRSPFHGISSEFCALCQSETCMDRVGKMQQMRMHKFLKQCHYMKRVVT